MNGTCRLVARLGLLASLALCLVLPASAALAQDAAANKQMVIDFYRMTFVEKRVKDAFERYVVESYIQHNPLVPTGREPAIKLLSERLPPTAIYEIKRAAADGDLVFLHVHARSNPQDRGRAVIDIFRVANGKVVEHWDVIQAVPETAANTNTMF